MRPAIQAICEEVARHFGYVTAEDIIGRSRSRSVAEARALAMWLARRRFDLSYPELGREFGRDHTTCMVAVAKIDGSTGALWESAQELSLANVGRAIKRLWKVPCQDIFQSSAALCSPSRAMLYSCHASN